MTRMVLGSCLLLLTADLVSAQSDTGHYPPGAEGLLAATLPGPGEYLRWYNIDYTADALHDPYGHDLPVGLRENVFATFPRFIWISDQKLLGADYGMDLGIPLVTAYVKETAARLDQSRTGVGDVLYEPILLGWHTDRWDVSFAAGVWAPTGEFHSADVVNTGKGYWTGMFTFGATYYFDEKKTWSLSGLGRYETNSSIEGRQIQPGDAFHIEWGLGKKIDNWNVGVTAYTHWQVTNDHGSGVTYDNSVHNSLYSVGPEVVYFHERLKMFFSARYQVEVGAFDRTQGQNIVLTVTKIF